MEESESLYPALFFLIAPCVLPLICLAIDFHPPPHPLLLLLRHPPPPFLPVGIDADDNPARVAMSRVLFTSAQVNRLRSQSPHSWPGILMHSTEATCDSILQLKRKDKDRRERAREREREREVREVSSYGTCSRFR